MNSHPRKDSDRSAGLTVLQTGIFQVGYQILLMLAIGFCTPLESWLRYDFGERYYSKGNYIGSLIAMYLWLILIGGLTWLISSLPLIGGVEQGGLLTTVAVGFGSIFMSGFDSLDFFWMIFKYAWYGHVILGAYHFYRMWYRSRTAQALHSFDPGKSRLGFVARWLFGPLNAVANVVARFLSVTIPARLRKHDERITPVFKNPDIFARLYLEPAVGVLMFLYFFTNGYGLFGLYFLLAAFGLSFVAKQQVLAEDGHYLDMRDRMIEKVFIGAATERVGRDHAYAEKQRLSPRAEDAAYQMSKIVENQPKMARQVAREDASLFDMMQEINPNLRKTAADPDASRNGATIIDNPDVS
jgi:hypothetical protein